MTSMHRYAASVLSSLRSKYHWEKEFLQAVEELFESITPILQRYPRYEKERILERIVEPERVVGFRVTWTDDLGEVHVNSGYRVQFNSALGPYKGGIRFHAQVSLDTLKFLAFEQTFKNALTGLSIGGGKGGADFQFRGRSDSEIMRFCQGFMSELFRHIGPDVDVPAGDIGVGGREIGYLFGQYKRLAGAFHGALTGKGQAWGGSALRPEATGLGVAYFAERMLRVRDDSLEGKTVAISGFGNVAWGTAKKITELGGRVVTLSGPDGFIHDPDGVQGEKLEFMLSMRNGTRDQVQEYAERFGVAFHANARPWAVPCDIAIPCAIQNELDDNDARALVEGKCKYVIEAANMPSTHGAVEILKENGVLFAPSKAANAGGVAVSAFEMQQNRTGSKWPESRVDEALRMVMAQIHDACFDAAHEYGHPGDYALGANIAGFSRVAEAMMDQGVL